MEGKSKVTLFLSLKALSLSLLPYYYHNHYCSIYLIQYKIERRNLCEKKLFEGNKIGGLLSVSSHFPINPIGGGEKWREIWS